MKLSLLSLFEGAPGMKGFDRPAGMQTHPSVDVLGQQLQKLAAAINQPNLSHEYRAKIAAKMQQILSQIATGGTMQQPTGGI